MKYKKGDRFVIEIDDVMKGDNDYTYRIKGFKTLQFDEYGLDRLERPAGEEDITMITQKVRDVAFKRGLEIMQKIMLSFSFGVLNTESRRRDVFGNTGLYACMSLPAEELLSKYNASFSLRNGDVCIDKENHTFYIIRTLTENLTNKTYSVHYLNGPRANVIDYVLSDTDIQLVTAKNIYTTLGIEEEK